MSRFEKCCATLSLLLAVCASTKCVPQATAACNSAGCTDKCFLWAKWCEADPDLGTNNNYIYAMSIAGCTCTNQATNGTCVLNQLIAWTRWDNCQHDCTDDNNCTGDHTNDANQKATGSSNVNTQCNTSTGTK